jgi:hypothetical protein
VHYAYAVFDPDACVLGAARLAGEDGVYHSGAPFFRQFAAHASQLLYMAYTNFTAWKKPAFKRSQTFKFFANVQGQKMTAPSLNLCICSRCRLSRTIKFKKPA